MFKHLPNEDRYFHIPCQAFTHTKIEEEIHIDRCSNCGEEVKQDQVLAE